MTTFNAILKISEEINAFQREKKMELDRVTGAGIYSSQHLDNIRQEIDEAVKQKMTRAKEEIRRILLPVFTVEDRKQFSDMEIQNELIALSLTADVLDVTELQDIYNRVYDSELLRNTLDKIAEKRNNKLARPRQKRDDELEKLQRERKGFFENWSSEQAKDFYELDGFSLLMQIEVIFEELENHE